MEEIEKLSEVLRLANRLANEKEKYEAFIKGFEELGDLYWKQGQLLNNNREKLKAVTVYNLALASEQRLREINSLSINVNNSELAETQSKIIEKIISIEEEIMLSASGDSSFKQTSVQYWESINQTKIILKSIRDDAKASLQQLNQVESGSSGDIISVQAIYQKISEALRDQLVKSLLESCFQMLPIPEGCIYSIIVLGSIARAEATPFSDFEFAVLIVDQGEEKNELHKSYFRHLTELLWIKVLNLGETTARMMDIQELSWLSESESPTRKGFAFDGQMEDGCHTPLGNMHHTDSKSQYELIGTPEELASFQADKWESKHGLSTVLSTVEMLVSNDQNFEKGLVQSYEEKMDEIFNAKAKETDNQTLIQRRSLKFLLESVERFQFRGGFFDKEVHYFDAKYHLYRLPNMLIDHLAMYFNIKAKSLWDRIEQIWGKTGIISNEKGVHNLKTTVSFILKLRLAAYLKKGYRDDHVLMMNPNKPEENQELMLKYFGLDQEKLFKIYSILIPLQWNIEKFIKKEGSRKILLESTYYDSSSFVKGFIHYLLLDYPKAANAYQNDIEINISKYGEHHILVANTWEYLGLVYKAQAFYSKAVAVFEKAKEIYIDTYGQNSHLVAGLLNNLGVIYEAQALYPIAINVYKEAKKIFTAVYSKHHILVANILNNLGLIYKAQAYYPKAIKVFEKAKEIYITMYGRDSHSVAGVLNNLGLIYANQAYYPQAIKYYEAAKKIYIATHGRNHYLVATTLNNLGVVYKAKERYIEATKIFEETKQIYLAIHGQHNRAAIADTLNNLGAVYEAQACYPKAIDAFKEAKQIYITTFGWNHRSVADVSNNLGAIYYKSQRRYLKAIKAYKNAKQIYITIHGREHRSVADVLNNLGIVYNARRQYSKAIKYYKIAKEIYINTHYQEHHCVADVLNNLGMIYQAQGCYTEAIESYEISKKIYIKTYGKEHTSVADVLRNLGVIYIELGDFEKARSCFYEASNIYNLHNHPKKEIIKKTLIISYLREWNSLTLKNEIDIDAIRSCYQKIRLFLNPNDPDVHQQLIVDAYNVNKLNEAIEHSKILIKLNVYDATVLQNLACFIHIYAQIEKDKNYISGYIKYLGEANDYFETAVKLEKNTAIYTECANFKLRNLAYYSVELVIALLQEAIKLKQLDKGLNYGLMERMTIDPYLQNLIDTHENNISFKAYFFAHYLLIQAYILNQQFAEAVQILPVFREEIKIFKEKNEEYRLALSIQMSSLSENDPNIPEITSLIEDNEKEEKLTDFLFEASEQIIESPEGDLARHILYGEKLKKSKLISTAISGQLNPQEAEPLVREQESLVSKVLLPQNMIDSEEAIHRIIFKKEEEKLEKSTQSREPLKNQQTFSVLLAEKIPAGLTLGSAYGQGDCFFDALAQSLNQINHTDVNTIKYLRMECHDFYAKNKAIVYQWNSQEYGGVDNRKDEYGMVQYTVEECNKHFYGRSPIWGRSQIEGIILCRQLDLEGICIIEILEDPETNQPVVSFHLANKERYKSIEETLAQELLKEAKIPVLVVEQNSLHFVPLLLNQTREVLVKLQTKDDIIKEPTSSALNQHGIFASSSQASYSISYMQPEPNNRVASIHLSDNDSLMQEELEDSDEENKNSTLSI